MENKKEFIQWFNSANSDLESAIFLKNMKPKPLEIICYHCEQSAEKYLKGFFVFKSIKPQKTHDLVFLCKELSKLEPDFKKLINKCDSLTIYSTNVRYPFYIQIEETDMEKAIIDAIEIKDFILNKIT